MINRILLALSSPVRFRPAARWTVSLAARLNAHLFAVYLLPADTGSDRTGPEELRTNRIRKHSSEEEKAWQVLYEIEDQSFNQNVRVSLLLETGEPLARLAQLCESYRIDLLVVSAETPFSPEHLLRHSQKPVVFFKTDKEE
ncbi:MAG: universal stress protein [candidate division WOR-3 bacterium]